MKYILMTAIILFMYPLSYLGLALCGDYEWKETVNINWLPYGVKVNYDQTTEKASKNLLGYLYFPLIYLDQNYWHHGEKYYDTHFNRL